MQFMKSGNEARWLGRFPVGTQKSSRHQGKKGILHIHAQQCPSEEARRNTIPLAAKHFARFNLATKTKRQARAVTDRLQDTSPHERSVLAVGNAPIRP